MNALDARTKANVANIKESGHIEMFLELIERSASKGGYKVELTAIVHPGHVESLKRLGYTVEVTNQGNNNVSDIKITW